MEPKISQSKRDLAQMERSPRPLSRNNRRRMPRRQVSQPVPLELLMMEKRETRKPSLHQDLQPEKVNRVKLCWLAEVSSVVHKLMSGKRLLRANSGLEDLSFLKLMLRH
jgi:hypothetical protein